MKGKRIPLPLIRESKTRQFRRPLDATNRGWRDSEELRPTGLDETAEFPFEVAVELLVSDDWVIVTQDPADVRLADPCRLRNGGRAETKHPANSPQPADVGIVLGRFPVKATGMPWNALCGAGRGIL